MWLAIVGWHTLAGGAARTRVLGAAWRITERRSGPAVRRALELLLGRETWGKHTLGFEAARLIGVEPARGFFTYYAWFDLALVLDLCWRGGTSLSMSY